MSKPKIYLWKLPLSPRAYCRYQALCKANETIKHRIGGAQWAATYLLELAEVERHMEKAILMEDFSL